MSESMRSVNILGVGTYFPQDIKTNGDFDYLAAGVSPQRVARAGVSSRRWAADDETIIDLAQRAAGRAIACSGVKAEDVDRIILVTSTFQPGLVVPTGAVRLQSRLGLQQAQAMTLVDTCCGALIAMDLGVAMVRGGMAQNVLVVAAETFSKTFNPATPTTFEIGMSMGDSAGAVVLGTRQGWEDGLIASYGRSAASFQSGLGMHPVPMGPGRSGARVGFGVGPAPPSYDGEPLSRHKIVDALKRFTTTTIPAAIRSVLEQAQLDVDDVAFFLLHQPNRMFLEAWKAEAGVPAYKTLDTLEFYGNLSSVSVLANLDVAWRSGRIRPGDKIVFASAGEGAVWGSMVWTWRLPMPAYEKQDGHLEVLTNVERHSNVELIERLAAVKQSASRVHPSTDTVPTETLVLDGVTVQDAFDYLADPSRLGEWTVSLRELESLEGDVIRTKDRMSPTNETYIRVQCDATSRTIFWELGHQPHRLWLKRRAVLTDAHDVVGRPGAAIMWTTTRGQAPDPKGERWAGVIGSALTIELQNLKRILNPKPTSHVRSIEEGGRMILADQVAIVAGGSKGIGRAVSRVLASNGAAVAVVARDQQKIDSTVAEIESKGGRALGVVADCRSKEEVDAMIRAVVKSFGPPQVLVNTIGGGQPELVLNTTDELFERMVGLNVKTAFLLSRAVAPFMIEMQKGKIIHTSSIGAKTPTPGLAVYDGCKAFVVAFTRDLALELGRFNVNVNCVCPGHVPTEATRAVGEKLCEIMGMDPQQLQEMVSQRMAIPKFSSADDIARLYLFLASSDSDYMTGQALNFSSGLEMR
jgi:3-oxoacyl-[acyl-carrier-protein] synthase III/NAD(P)-dependent dehydrogenase (short-subunit alcohol dehydrogenase family)